MGCRAGGEYRSEEEAHGDGRDERDHLGQVVEALDGVAARDGGQAAHAERAHGEGEEAGEQQDDPRRLGRAGGEQGGERAERDRGGEGAADLADQLGEAGLDADGEVDEQGAAGRSAGPGRRRPARCRR